MSAVYAKDPNYFLIHVIFATVLGVCAIVFVFVKTRRQRAFLRSVFPKAVAYMAAASILIPPLCVLTGPFPISVVDGYMLRSWYACWGTVLNSYAILCGLLVGAAIALVVWGRGAFVPRLVRPEGETFLDQSPVEIEKSSPVKSTRAQHPEGETFLNQSSVEIEQASSVKSTRAQQFLEWVDLLLPLIAATGFFLVMVVVTDIEWSLALVLAALIGLFTWLRSLRW